MKSSIKLFATDRLLYVLGLFVIFLVVVPSSFDYINNRIAIVKANLQGNYHTTVSTATFTTGTTTITTTGNYWNRINNTSSNVITTRKVISVGKPIDDDTTTTRKKVINVIVLVHGFMGNSKELLYMEQTLKQIGTDRHRYHYAGIDSEDNVEEDEEWIIHSATCNEYNTFDGIVAGGTRLANEINTILDTVKQRDNPYSTTTNNITLSIVGSSLGGLYSRYALSKINFTNNIIPISFITIATPHLGVDTNTYIPLSRSIEYFIANYILSYTGLDLFRFTSIIDQMSIDDQFLQPLQSFYYRYSYANAYHTDHVVPLRTAAFLSSSTSTTNTNTNYTVQNHNQQSKTLQTSNTTTSKITTSVVQKQISIIVQTQQQKRDRKTCTSTGNVYNITTNTCTYNNNNNNNNVVNDKYNTNRLSLDEMAIQLDSLGWTKVLCDIRNVLPPIPPLRTSFFTGSLWSFTGSLNAGGLHSLTSTLFGMGTSVPKLSKSKESSSVEDVGNSNSNNHQLKQRRSSSSMISSSELLKLYGSTTDDQLVVPMGHSMLGAHAHFTFFGYINSGGRPLIEYMSNTIIQQITSI